VWSVGAVCFGLQPGVVVTRKSRLTYGVSVLNRFRRGVDPESKLAVRDGVEWCSEVFDPLVVVGQSVAVGETVTRRYAPAAVAQRLSVFTVYSTDKPHPRFVTDRGVRRSVSNPSSPVDMHACAGCTFHNQPHDLDLFEFRVNR